MTALGEITREAKRVLPRLIEEGAFAKPIKKQQIGIFRPKNKWRHPLLTCSDVIMKAFLKCELVRVAEADECPVSGTLVEVYLISELGHRFVTRLFSDAMPHRTQHQIRDKRYIFAPGQARKFYQVNLAESPLGWLRKRKGSNGKPLISETEYAAGERLREDFTRAQMTPRVTSNWSPTPATGAQKRGPSDWLCVQDSVLAAKKRLQGALEKVGPGLADILLQTCCYLNGLEQAERELGWPQRSGKVVLQIGLARLVEHYGMATSRRLSPVLRSWTGGESR